jgi:hypothetical protein
MSLGSSEQSHHGCEVTSTAMVHPRGDGELALGCPIQGQEEKGGASASGRVTFWMAH